MMDTITVMLTGCAAKYTPGYIHCLKDNGEREVRIVGTDCSDDKTILQLVDECYQVPYATDPQYADTLLDICKKRNVDILIPSMSSELMTLLDRQKDFEENGIKLSISNRRSLELTLSKLKLYQFMNEAGLRTPKFAELKSTGELEQTAEMLGYPDKPVVFKATQSSGSRGVRIIDPKKTRFDILYGEKPNSLYVSMRELKEILSEHDGELPETMLVEYLPGAEYDHYLLADSGRVIYQCGMYCDTIESSITQIGILKYEEDAYKLCEQLTNRLGLDGNADFDFKYDENGVPVLMEINPRIAATMRIFKEGGLNLAYFRIKQLLGEELPEVNIRYGTKMVRRYLEQFD